MIPKKVLICGIPHRVVLCEDNFDTDLHLGQINYGSATIRVNGSSSEELQEEALFHEMLHGILVHLGRNDEAQNECFVQSLANAIYQSFQLREGKYE